MRAALLRQDRTAMTPSVRRLVPADAARYRSIMLEAYERHPDAFTSSVSERAPLPLTFWESRLVEEPHPLELVLGAFREGELAGIAGLSFETREKARHKAKLFGMYVLPNARHG